MPPSLGTHTRARPNIVPMYQRGINSWRVRVRPHTQTQLLSHPTIPPQPPLHKHQERSKLPRSPNTPSTVSFDVRAGVLHFRSYQGKPNLSASPPSDFVSWVRGLRAADVPRPRNRMWAPLLFFHCFHVSPRKHGRAVGPCVGLPTHSCDQADRRAVFVGAVSVGACRSIAGPSVMMARHIDMSSCDV